MAEEANSQDDQREPSAPAIVVHIPPLAPDSIPTTPAAVSNAKLEAQGLANANLDDVARRRDHSRREVIRDIVHWIKVGFLITIFLLIILAILIVAFHAMTPWHFLTPDQLGTLQTMLTSSVVTGVAATMGKNIIKDIN